MSGFSQVPNVHTMPALTGRPQPSAPLSANMFLGAKDTGTIIRWRNIRIASQKLGGSGPSKQENQDAIALATITHGEHTAEIYVVCDGHGTYGMRYADTVAYLMIATVCAQFSTIITEPVTMLKALFTQINSETRSFGHGGTTCTVTIVMHDRIICANVGDSEAITRIHCPSAHITSTIDSVPVVVEPTEGSADITHLRLTTDHSGFNPVEAARVLSSGARVEYMCRDLGQAAMYSHAVVDGIPTYQFIDPRTIPGTYATTASGQVAHYITDPISLQQLNMSRSMGDWAAVGSRLGAFIIAEPSVNVVTFPPGTRVRLVTGSDGYFNCIPESAQFAVASKTMEEVITDGFAAAYRLFPGRTPGTSSGDNLTVLVYDSEPLP